MPLSKFFQFYHGNCLHHLSFLSLPNTSLEWLTKEDSNEKPVRSEDRTRDLQQGVLHFTTKSFMTPEAYLGLLVNILRKPSKL